MRKRCTAAILILSITASLLSFVANAEDNIRIFINDSQITSDVPPVIEYGRTLVPIRVIAEYLNCEVNWIAEENTAEIKNDRNVLRLPVGEYTYILNGRNIMADMPAKIINDRTFVPLRLVANCFNCRTIWNDSERAVYITEYPKYEDNPNALYEFGIIGKDDLNNDEYITVREALQLFLNIAGRYRSDFLREWYYGDTLAPLDYLDDSDKELLMSLANGTPVLTKDDILEIRIDDKLTNYEALKYIIRMLGSTYGCTDVIEELSLTEKAQIYDRAYEKGLIDEIDIDSSDLPIKRADFYKLIYKSLFVEFSRGGAGGISILNYADICLKRKENKNTVPTEKPEPVSHKISVDYTINDDMSVLWTIPDEYKDVITDDSHVEVGLYTADNEKIGGYMSIGIRTEISPEQLIQWLIRKQSEKAAYLRVRYDNYNTQTMSSDEEWIFDIAMPDIEISVEGDAIEPGEFTTFERQWVPKTITLAGGREFKKGAYYVITSYEHNYRKKEYNHVMSAIWKAETTSDTFDNSNPKNSLYCGGLDLDDMYIQEITVKGDAKSGFTLCVTPQSQNKFKVIK